MWEHCSPPYSFVNEHKREAIPVSELRAAAALRLLDQAPPANGVVLAANTLGGSVSPRLKVPRLRMLDNAKQSKMVKVCSAYCLSGE